jgi:hypothetical protein
VCVALSACVKIHVKGTIERGRDQAQILRGGTGCAPPIPIPIVP